jgi:tetratricopeptide (TPR) repeat protein
MTRPGSLRRCAVTLVLAALTASSAEAYADAPMTKEMRAEQLFRAGEKSYDSGRYAEACSNFEESLKLGPKLGTLLNLALCHETVGKVATAWSEFQYGAAWAAQNNQRDRREFAVAHILSLEPRLPRVSLQLPAATTIATLDVDGDPLPEPRWYLPLYLDPGEHHVVVTSPGKKRSDVSFRVIASPNEQIVTIASLEDAGPAAPAAPSPEADPHAARRKTGYVLLGVGGAAFVTGAAFGVLAIAADDPDVKPKATIATLAFVAAGAAAAGGVWLVLSSRASGKVGVAPRPGGLSLVGTF